MTAYEKKVLGELNKWQRKMLRKPSYLNNISKKMQTKINSLLPEKVHQGITAVIKQMTRAVLFSAQHTTDKPKKFGNLEKCEIAAEENIRFYQKTAAAEGGITGAGGILLGLADFPLLISLKLKLLYDIAALYGYTVSNYKERLYMLFIFQLAFSSHEHRKNIYLKMVPWNEISKTLPEDINEFDWRSFQQEYRDYIDLAKIAQLIPIIGAPVGAVVNYRLIRKLGDTAIQAYRMRWFENEGMQLVKA